MSFLRATRTLTWHLIAGASMFVPLACGDTAGDDAAAAPSDMASSSSQTDDRLAILPASEESAQLDIAQWQIESGFVRGLSPSNETVVEFYVDGVNRIVETVSPDSGYRNLEDPTDDTLSARSARYLDAMAADLDAAMQASARYEADGNVVDKAVLYACYAIYSNCDVAGFAGIYYGYWTYYNCLYPTTACPPNGKIGLWVQ